MHENMMTFCAAASLQKPSSLTVNTAPIRPTYMNMSLGSDGTVSSGSSNSPLWSPGDQQKEQQTPTSSSKSSLPFSISNILSPEFCPSSSDSNLTPDFDGFKPIFPVQMVSQPASFDLTSSFFAAAALGLANPLRLDPHFGQNMLQFLTSHCASMVNNGHTSQLKAPAGLSAAKSTSQPTLNPLNLSMQSPKENFLPNSTSSIRNSEPKHETSKHLHNTSDTMSANSDNHRNLKLKSMTCASSKAESQRSPVLSSPASVANESKPSPSDQGNSSLRWPAWVYCTRYSDRPSSGPRTRKPKRKAQIDEKRPRTAFTPDQLQRLKTEFQENRYLTEKRRQNLAGELGLKESQIKIWFQNKRAKLKKGSNHRNPLALHLMAQGLYNHAASVSDHDGRMTPSSDDFPLHNDDNDDLFMTELPPVSDSAEVNA